MMDINHQFSILISYSLNDNLQSSINLDASNFFSTELDDFSEDEWSPYLPWEKADLCDYLPLKPDQFQHLQLLTLDIVDRVNNIHRRVIEQRWNGHKVTRDFSNLNDPIAKSHLWFCVSEKSPDTSQIMQTELLSDSFRVINHSRIISSGLKEAVEFFDHPVA
ncbi:MAG: hypothetical protein ACO1RA_17170 [Planctomycetaceae bacterium]